MREFITALILVSVAVGKCYGHTCNHDPQHSAADFPHSHESHSHESHSHESHESHSQEFSKRLLPEELAEEEDLRLYGSGSGFDDHDERLSTLELWGYAMGCSLLVSMASLICLTILPIISVKGTPSPNLVNALAAFGGGAMMGDAFLHQLPHAFGKLREHSHSHSHSYSHPSSHEEHHAHTIEELSVGLSVIAGIVLFFIVEKIVRYVEDHSFESSHHHHRHKPKQKKDDDSSETKATDGKHTDEKKKPDEKSIEKEHVDPQSSKLVLGYLNLFSDGVHNFTDGMALGAAFLLHGTRGGWSRTFFLLVHELPQEVGDFGILVRSGFSVFKALAFNFLSALVALAGTAAALLFGANPGQSSVIEGFTAGGFLYISIAGVLPEMQQGGSSLKNTLLQLTALSCGIGVAVAISVSE